MRVQPGPFPGTTSWSALAPAGRSAQAWAAVCDLAADYCQADAALTVAQARADAFLDLILAQAQVSTTCLLYTSLDAGDKWPTQAVDGERPGDAQRLTRGDIGVDLGVAEVGEVHLSLIHI